MLSHLRIRVPKIAYEFLIAISIHRARDTDCTVQSGSYVNKGYILSNLSQMINIDVNFQAM